MIITPVEIPDDRLEALTKLHLKHGGHESFSRGVCAMEMVAYLAGEPHSDHPACTCPVLASYVRRLNDSMPDDATRDKWLKPILPQLIGTVADPETAQQRAFALADAALRIFTPRAFDAAVDALKRAGLPAEAETLSIHAAALRALPPVESAAWSAESAESAARSAWSAESAARSAARSAWSAARSAWSAESAARSAAWSAESAARSARSAWSAARSARSAWSAESAARSAAIGALAWPPAESTLAAAAAWSAESAESAESAAAKDAVWQEAIAVLERLLTVTTAFDLDAVFGDEYLTEKEPVDPRDQPETQEGGAE